MKSAIALACPSYEGKVVEGIADALPQYAGGLDALAERLTDLLAIVRKSYYHPDFRGSLSTKAALPVIVPALNCDDMKITDGGPASPSYMRVLTPADPGRAFAALTQSDAFLEQCWSVSEAGSGEL